MARELLDLLVRGVGFAHVPAMGGAMRRAEQIPELGLGEMEGEAGPHEEGRELSKVAHGRTRMMHASARRGKRRRGRGAFALAAGDETYVYGEGSLGHSYVRLAYGEATLELGDWIRGPFASGGVVGDEASSSGASPSKAGDWRPLPIAKLARAFAGLLSLYANDSAEGATPHAPFAFRVFQTCGHEAPVARRRAPIARQRTPIARQRMPIARQRMPIARERTPIARERAPIAIDSTRTAALEAGGAFATNAVYPAPMAMRGPQARAEARSGRDVGSLIASRFRVQQALGVGGMGAVYRVADESTGRQLALKTFGGPAARSESERHRLRFRHEFHTMAGLVHPRIVQVFDYGLDGEMPYYTMELLDGHDLGDLGQVEPKRACELLRDVASALAFLHVRHLIHRDLAPRNVRCTSDGRAKLIDFGVLATAGYAGDIAGTPPLISPENVRGLPIDHRADLFGLGALAYFVLTGRHAYPARSIDELEAIWRAQPPPPSFHAPSVPAALDTLVTSLLSFDPLARPGTAAEVIDRLGAIGGLAPSPEGEVARGYLASASLVGRQRELELLRRRIGRAVLGDGGAAMLEAPSGRGKSRLLRELALEAQVAGATVLRADSESAGRGPYGLFGALARALLAAAPDEAIEAAHPRASVLVRVVPDLGKRLGPVKVAPPAGGAEEERMRAQAELSAWFLEVTTKRPLALLVDDVQRSDEASAAVLAALAHAAPGNRLLVVSALRTDEAVRATIAVSTLRDRSQRVRVRALEAEDVEELMRGMFGAVPHLTRLATWMQKAGGGSPLHCIELARHLVDRGVIRYADGFWSVPDEPRLEGMPRKLAEAMETRIRALRPEARALAEALCIHGGELSLSLCVLIADAPSEDKVFAAIDELLQEEILVGSEGSYRFRHDGLREALLRNLDAERKRRLHLRVGKALAGQGFVSPEREAEVGWHLLQGGDRSAGADLLARAGIRLYEAQSFSDSVAPIEAALEVYEAEKRSVRKVLELRHMLVMAGCFSNRAVALKYADDTIAALSRISGMDLVLRLARVLPRPLALLVGVGWAAIVRLFAVPSRRGPGPVAALQALYTEVAYTSVVRSWSIHIEESRALLRYVEPLAVIKNRIPEGAYLLTAAVANMPLGRFGLVRRSCKRILEIATNDKVTPITDSDRKNAIGAAHVMQATASLLSQDADCADVIARVEAMGLRYFDVDAQLHKMALRRFRGEEEAAVEMESTIDVLMVQAGSMWGPESRRSWFSSLAYGLTRDVLGLRRVIQRLDHWIEQGFRLEPYRDLARGEYHRERGELEESRRALEQAIAVLAPDEAMVRPAALGALSETLLAMNDAEGAVDKAKRAIEVAGDPDVACTSWRLRGMRALGLALAAKGDLAEGTAELDRALDEASPLGSPALCGGLHEARARVAMLAGDVAAYALHRNATDSWFRSTNNPALIARVARLPEPDKIETSYEVNPEAAPRTERVTEAFARATRERATAVTEGAVSMATETDARQWIMSMLRGCRGPAERAARALEIIVDAAGASAGYLYFVHAGALELVAPAYGEEPPEEVVSSLRALFDEGRAEPPGERAEIAWQPDAVRGKAAWFRAALRVERPGGSKAFGAVAVVGAASHARPPPPKLLERIAIELHDAGDMTASVSSRRSQ